MADGPQALRESGREEKNMMRRRDFCAGALSSLFLSLQRTVLAAQAVIAPASNVPFSIDLSGEWEFRIDPLDVGLTERWFETAVSFERKIQVPGAWNAQGVAFESEDQLREYETKSLKERSTMHDVVMSDGHPESDRLFHVYPGPGWYRKRVTIPDDWKGKVPWLVFAGVHREADVWINNQLVGAHRSYLTPFRLDISSHAKAGEIVTIVVRVDANRKREVDPLLGCMDTLDFLYVTWGGIHRPVTLEATGQSRIEDVFILPHLATETAEIRISVQGKKIGRLAVSTKILDAGGVSIASVQQSVADDGAEIVLMPRLAKAKLWSPKTPYLYTAEIQLLSGTDVIDARSIRFGMREFKVEAGNFLLNGKPIFLRGYGDDCIFPNTICPPADKSEFRSRLSRAREYGFNYVRHHSWIPPNEYLEAADELGMMLQPEFPFVGRPDFSGAPEARRVALEQWIEVIRLNRNHPSIVTWCMGNEIYNSFDLAPAIYEAAKRLDPSRPVIDTDGCDFKNKDRKTLDFMVVQFNEGDSMGYQDGKYNFPSDIGKPVIAHEMGYFATLPDLAQLKLFDNGLRPYWISDTHALAQQNGLLDVYPDWLAASYRLQAVSLKSNVEAARRSALKGTSVWLFQDYPNCAEGVTDMFLRPKGLLPEEFRKFNSPTVLLLDAPRRNWWSGETAEFKFVVSRFEDAPSDGAKLHWVLKSGSATLLEGVQENLQIHSGEVQELSSFQLEIPARPQSERLTLTAELIDANGKAENSWDLWAFPKELVAETSHKGHMVRCDLSCAKYLSAQGHSGGTIPLETELFITTKIDEEVLEYLQSGGRVLLLEPEPIFPLEKTDFRLSAWDGKGPSGTIFDAKHPALSAMPSEGWCDLQFYSLIQGSKTILLDSLPTKIQPLVRCIDRPTRLANRAYLFEAQVSRGKLLVSGFNFAESIASKDPAGIFLLDRLVNYTLGGEFNPEVAIPESALKPML